MASIKKWVHDDAMMKSNDENRISNITPFGLRLVPDLKRRIEEAARANGRSLNAEIAFRLEASLEMEGDTRSAEAARRLLKGSGGEDLIPDLVRRLDEHEKRIKHLEGGHGGRSK